MKMPRTKKNATCWLARSRCSVSKPTGLGFALIVSLAFGCNSANDKSQSELKTQSHDNVLDVNVMRLTREATTIETSVFFGTLVPNRQSRLGFGRGGLIKNAFKRVGDQVSQGERLAELQQEQLDLRKRDLEQAIKDSRQSTPPNQAEGSSTQELEAQLQKLDLELAKGVIVAPYDCIVADISAEVGDLVSQQTPVLQVVENAQPNVEANLPVKIVDRLQVGQMIWLGFGEQTAQAQLETKSPFESSAASKKIALKITTALESGAWSYGQSVEIRFLLPSDNTGFWLPWSALSRENNGLWSTLAVSPKTNLEQTDSKDVNSDDSTATVSRKMLELVQLEDEWALVTGSLQEGEFVIVNGLHRIVPGQRVKTIDITSQFSKPDAGAR